MITPFKIAILGGDGVGPEVVAESVNVLRAVETQLTDIRFDRVEHSGGGEFLRSSDPRPPATLERIGEADAILLGATDLPSVRWPRGIEMTPLIDLREQLDLFTGVRAINDAVTRVLAVPDHRTADLGGQTSTTQMGPLICQALT
jgi:3-isopropylmalate dehydrogenase